MRTSIVGVDVPVDEALSYGVPVHSPYSMTIWLAIV